MATSQSSLFIKLAIVAGAGYLGYKAYENKLLPTQVAPDPLPPTPAAKKTRPASTTKSTVPLSQFPLKRGSRGDYVRTLQKNLGVTADGIFGPATEAALTQRYGKTQILTLAELNTLISTSTSLPTTSRKVSVPARQTDFQKTLIAQQQAIFNAVWEALNLRGKVEYGVRTSIDNAIIAATLGSMSDAYLKGFASAYAKSFRNVVFLAEDNRKGTLLDDISRVSSLFATPTYYAQLARVKQL